MGTSYENFRGIVEKLREHDAIRIVRANELKEALAELMAGTPESIAMGAQGREVFESEAGATQRAVQALMELLDGAQANPADRRRAPAEVRA